MAVKYQGKSGAVHTYDELREWYRVNHPDDTDLAFDFWLYFGVEFGAIKEIVE